MNPDIPTAEFDRVAANAADPTLGADPADELEPTQELSSLGTESTGRPGRKKARELPPEPDTPEGPCPECGSPIAASDQFCEACGHSQSDPKTAQKPGPKTRPPKAALPGPDTPACVPGSATAGGTCDHCGTRQPDTPGRVEHDLQLLAGVSDIGFRHHDNEDALAMWCAVLPGEGVRAVAVVCDGVSSSNRPRDASRAGAKTAADVLVATAGADPADPEEALRAATERAAAEVAALDEPPPVTTTRPPGSPAEPRAGTNPPSSTFVAAVVTDQTITVGWIGDSRAYWLAPPGGETDGSACLTEDDSWAGQMVAWGLLDPDEAQADPRAHALARWLGADAPDTDPRTRTITPSGPGVLVLCSDGLWNYLPGADEMAAVALPGAFSDPLEAARTLTRVALDGGGRDNITVAVLPFPLKPGIPGRSDPS